jgi:predicted CoA-binding protein
MVAARTFAVLGASRNPEKYGFMVYQDLKQAGKTVYPINPGAADIDGDPAFASLSSLPAVPDVAVFVVPPSISELAVEECARLGIRNIWMQEGAESDEAIRRCVEHAIAVVHGGPCIMVLLRTHGYLHR